jgi:hypothetical protein
MHQAFLDYYRCPASYVDFRSFSLLQSKGTRQNEAASIPLDGDEIRVDSEEGCCYLPFDPTAIADELRYERYVDRSKKGGWKNYVRKVYYAFRPLLPVSTRRHLQKVWLRGWDKKRFPRWPVDRSIDQMFERLMRATLEAKGVERIPFVWFWPEQKKSCAIMTHDVETDAGLKFCNELMDINDSFGIKSSFQLIPDARYVVTDKDLKSIKSRGFEVNVHDLKHDGHLFDEYATFQHLARKINEFGYRFKSKGFRSAVLYRNQEWFGALQFSYDMSVPNVAHLDPQQGGCCTVMPYFIGDVLEIPVTATQDYTLFHILGTHSLRLWKQQMEMIMEQFGLISFIVHPDYLNTRKAVNAYQGLLENLAKLREEDDVWIPLPGEVDTWWRQRSKMRITEDGEGWRIEGEGAGSAKVAFARLRDDKVVYEFA